MTKAQAKRLDREIEAIFVRLAQGKQINIMDIGKVFAAGYLAAKDGTSIEVAVQGAVDALCVQS